MSGINNLSSSYLQSILSSALPNTGLSINGTSNILGGIDASSVAPPSDKGQLSPLAQMMSTLQQLQQSNPAKYQQASTDFTNASKRGNFPTFRVWRRRSVAIIITIPARPPLTQITIPAAAAVQAVV